MQLLTALAATSIRTAGRMISIATSPNPHRTIRLPDALEAAQPIMMAAAAMNRIHTAGAPISTATRLNPLQSIQLPDALETAQPIILEPAAATNRIHIVSAPISIAISLNHHINTHLPPALGHAPLVGGIPACAAATKLTLSVGIQINTATCRLHLTKSQLMFVLQSAMPAIRIWEKII